MDAIRREFEQHLGIWQRQYVGYPELEIVRLSLLALEREENVTVAYGDGVLRQRLAAISVPRDVREVMHQALVEVWKDEEWHTRYVRRTLLQHNQPLVAARTVFHQTAGAAGGWTVAVRQHRRWAQAPLSRAAATLLLWMGRLTGQVPRSVLPHLNYCSFEEFCRYNVHTETTAWLCWRRLTELAAQVPAIAPQQMREFARIAEDEDRHRRVFGVLADAVADSQRPRAVVTREGLLARLRAATVGQDEATALPL